jgi:hypothetical protein
MLRIFITMFIALSLTACAGTRSDVRVVEKIRNVPVELDARLLEPCVIPTPPEKDYYMSLNVSERETVLAKYSASLMKSLSKCGKQIDEIKEVQEKAIKKLKEGS